MERENKIPSQEDSSIEDNAINKKANQSDGKDINHQVEKRRDQHQPRDNA